MQITTRRLAIGTGLLVLVALAALVRPAAVLPALRAVLKSPWFPAIVVGLYLVRPFLGWPVMLISAMIGYRYGVAVGVPLALAGTVFTSLIPYAAGRVSDLDGPILGRFSVGSQRFFRTAGDLRGVIAARLAPMPAEPVSAAAGVGGVALPAFALGTVIGELPWTIAAVTVGHTMTVFDPTAVGVDWRLVAAGLLAGLVLVAGPVYRAYAAARGRGTGGD